MGYKYKKYNGKDKYHFRHNKKVGHPALITKSDSRKTEGYNMTTSPNRKRMRNYRELKPNPNQNSGKKTYLRFGKFNENSNMFSKPYNNWHLSNRDKIFIDSLEKRKK